MFKRMKDESLGTGLWFTLPTVTNAMVRAKFGTGLVSQDLEKYSDTSTGENKRCISSNKSTVTTLVTSTGKK
jgi:hypothetical protein